MDIDQLHAWTAENRRLFADTVDELGEEAAGEATLCEGWDVRTLTAHLLQPIRVPSWRFLLTAARVRSMERACDVIAARIGDRPLGEVTAELRRRAGEKATPWYIGAAGPFVDSCIHLRDLAEPHGLEVSVPLAHWRAALEIIVSKRGTEAFVPGKGLLDGLRWEATDTDWGFGDGPQVRGGTEALAMVMSGRTAYLEHLDGEGLSPLRERLLG